MTGLAADVRRPVVRSESHDGGVAAQGPGALPDREPGKLLDPVRGARLHVVFPFTGDGIGGSHVSAFTLIDGLLRQGDVAVTIVAPDETPIAAEVRRRGLPFAPSGEPPIARRALYRYVQGLPRRIALLRRIAGQGPTLLHVNDFEALVAWRAAATFLGLPIIYHHRQLPAMSWLKRAILASVDHTVMISDVCRQNAAFLPQRRATAITNPVELDLDHVRSAARRDLRAELGFVEQDFVFGFLANLADRKRPEFFIDAAAHILRRRPEAAFVMLGREIDVAPDALWARARALGIDARLRIEGFRTPVEDNLAMLDALLAPAINEPFGRTPVEAALAGIPYVVTDDAGHHEIAARWGGGVAVPRTATAAEFAAVALGVMASPATFTLAPGDREQLRADVSPERHAARVRAIYDGLIAGRGSESTRAIVSA